MRAAVEPRGERLAGECRGLDLLAELIAHDPRAGIGADGLEVDEQLRAERFGAGDVDLDRIVGVRGRGDEVLRTDADADLAADEVAELRAAGRDWPRGSRALRSR